MAKKKVIATIDTSDPFSTDPGSTMPTPLPQPINPFASQPSSQPTGLDAQRLQMPVASKPADLAPAPSLNLATKEQTNNAKSSPVLSYMAPAAAGLSAGAQVQPTTDSSSAILQAGTAGLGGAAAGALSGAAIGAAGGPIGAAGGAVIGGLTGLVSGGIQAYTGLKEARKNKRAQEKQIAQINKWNQDERNYQRQQDALHRSDTQEQLRYNRRQDAVASQWKAMQSTIDILNQNMKQDDNIHSMFLAGAH